MRIAPLFLSAALALGLALVGACVPDFQPASQLDETPQVLAVRAEPPAVSPGETVRLDALVHWTASPTAPATALEHLWLVCRPTPADTLDTCVSNRLGQGGVLLLPCAGAPSEPLCFASRDATAVYTVPADLDVDADGNATIFVELVVGDDVESDDCVRAYRDLDPAQRCLVALKRLTVSADSPHVNPRLAPLRVDGEPADASTLVSIDPAATPVDKLEVTLAVDVVPASVDELDGDEPPEEVRLPVAWYATCGSFSEDTDDVVCQPPPPGESLPACEPVQTTWKPDASGECTVHVTLRDDRGGVGWITQHFVVGS